jgi:nitrogen fixation/metabolism regulation signal transduction histidine kinase
MFKLKHPGSEVDRHLVETAHSILYLNSLFWPAALALLVFIFSHVIYTTHKIAGPIYRLRKVIMQVANGDVSQNFVIRKGDYLTKEAKCLNEMINNIRPVLSDIKDKHGRIAKNFAEIVQSLEADYSDEMMKKIKVIEESCRLVRSKLDYFKV